MNSKNIYASFRQAKKVQQKKFAVLIDPDKLILKEVDHLVKLATAAQVDFFFLGGSLVINNQLDAIIERIKKQTSIPVVLFPGSSRQLSYKADALLFLSLISLGCTLLFLEFQMFSFSFQNRIRPRATKKNAFFIHKTR